MLSERESSHRTMRVTETDVPWLLCRFDAGHVMPSARSTVIETTGRCRLIVAVGFTSWMLNGRQVRRIETFDKADGHRTPVGSFCLLPWVGIHLSSRAASPFPARPITTRAPEQYVLLIGAGATGAAFSNTPQSISNQQSR